MVKLISFLRFGPIIASYCRVPINSLTRERHMNLKKIGFSLAIAFSALSANRAQAQFVTSSGGITGTTSVIDFSLFGHNSDPIIPTASPATFMQAGSGVGHDVRMSYESGTGGLYAGFQGWGLLSNGNWDRFSIGLNQTGVLRYTFADGPVSGVGALMSYAAGGSGTNVFVRTLDNLGNVIDQVNVLSVAPITGQGVNQGLFRGFQYSTAKVYSFEVGGDGNSSPIMTDLTFTSNGSTSTVTPEPASLALVGAGLFAVGFVTRKRRSQR